MKDAHLFNEYRMRDAISGREAEATVGLRNGWQVADGLRLNTTFERVNPITGSNQNVEATAVTLGFDYTRDPLSKTSGRVEFRTDDAVNHWLTTFGYAAKLNDDWTLLARNILNYDQQKTTGQGDLIQSRLQLGGAYRPTRTDVWNGLLKGEYKYEDDQTQPAENLRRHVLILTAQVNFQPLTNLTLSARYAPKLVIENDSADNSTYIAHLLAGRLMYDLTQRWSIGLNGSAFFNGRFRQLQFGLGPEIGFRVHDNIWIDAGYNLLGFHDRDLSAENYTDHGFYIGIRMTFDEHIADFARGRGKQ
jgi:opacity protein-like surface antigen